MKITCQKCNWKWTTEDSNKSDQYICHKCNTNNTPFSLKNIYEQLTKKYTSDDIRKLVSSKEIAAIRAILRIYLFQTKYEQDNSTTNEKNKVGFTAGDAKGFAPIIKQIEQIGWLNSKQIDMVKRAAIKYSAQIATLLNKEELKRGNTELDKWVDILANKWNQNKDKNFVGLGLSFRYHDMRPQDVTNRIPKDDIIILLPPSQTDAAYYLINKKFEDLPKKMNYNNFIIIPEQNIVDFIQYAKRKPIFDKIKKRYNI